MTSPRSNSTRSLRDAGDTTAADAVTGGDIEFLSDASAKYLGEMLGVGAG